MNKTVTRKHSSGMRTDRFSNSGGGRSIHPTHTDRPGCRPPPPRQTNLDAGQVTCGACYEANPSCGQTNKC